MMTARATHRPAAASRQAKFAGAGGAGTQHPPTGIIQVLPGDPAAPARRGPLEVGLCGWKRLTTPATDSVVPGCGFAIGRRGGIHQQRVEGEQASQALHEQVEPFARRERRFGLTPEQAAATDPSDEVRGKWGEGTD